MRRTRESTALDVFTTLALPGVIPLLKKLRSAPQETIELDSEQTELINNSLNRYKFKKALEEAQIAVATVNSIDTNNATRDAAREQLALCQMYAKDTNGFWYTICDLQYEDTPRTQDQLLEAIHRVFNRALNDLTTRSNQAQNSHYITLSNELRLSLINLLKYEEFKAAAGRLNVEVNQLLPLSSIVCTYVKTAKLLSLQRNSELAIRILNQLDLLTGLHENVSDTRALIYSHMAYIYLHYYDSTKKAIDIKFNEALESSYAALKWHKDHAYALAQLAIVRAHHNHMYEQAMGIYQQAKEQDTYPQFKEAIDAVEPFIYYSKALHCYHLDELELADQMCDGAISRYETLLGQCSKINTTHVRACESKTLKLKIQFKKVTNIATRQQLRAARLAFNQECIQLRDKINVSLNQAEYPYAHIIRLYSTREEILKMLLHTQVQLLGGSINNDVPKMNMSIFRAIAEERESFSQIPLTPNHWWHNYQQIFKNFTTDVLEKRYYINSRNIHTFYEHLKQTIHWQADRDSYQRLYNQVNTTFGLSKRRRMAIKHITHLFSMTGKSHDGVEFTGSSRLIESSLRILFFMMFYVDHNIDPPEGVSKQEVLEFLQKEIALELEAYTANKFADAIEDISDRQMFTEYNKAHAEHILDILMHHLQPGETYLQMSGYRSHRTYVNYIRSKKDITIRIDNRGGGYSDYHCVDTKNKKKYVYPWISKPLPLWMFRTIDQRFDSPIFNYINDQNLAILKAHADLSSSGEADYKHREAGDLLYGQHHSIIKKANKQSQKKNRPMREQRHGHCGEKSLSIGKCLRAMEMFPRNKEKGLLLYKWLRQLERACSVKYFQFFHYQAPQDDGFIAEVQQHKKWSGLNL